MNPLHAGLLCSESEVLQLLLSLDITKSNGPDGISGKMLKATAGRLLLPCVSCSTFLLNLAGLPVNGSSPQSYLSQKLVLHLLPPFIDQSHFYLL